MRDDGELVRAKRHSRKVVEAGPHRSEQVRETPVRRSLADSVEADRVLEREWSGGGAAERPEIRGVADGRPEIAREGPDIGACGTRHVDHRERTIRVRHVPPFQAESMKGRLASR